MQIPAFLALAVGAVWFLLPRRKPGHDVSSDVAQRDCRTDELAALCSGACCRGRVRDDMAPVHGEGSTR